MIDEKDREIWVGENRFYLGEDGILHVTMVGDTDEKIELEILEAHRTLRSKVEGKVNTFTDLTNMGKPTPGARKMAKEGLEEEGIGKIALFGLHPVARVVASFIMGVSKKEDMRFFNSKEGALAWLREGNKT